MNPQICAWPDAFSNWPPQGYGILDGGLNMLLRCLGILEPRGVTRLPNHTFNHPFNFVPKLRASTGNPAEEDGQRPHWFPNLLSCRKIDRG